MPDLNWKCTLITQLRTLKFMPTTTRGQAEPEDLVLIVITNHTLLMQGPHTPALRGHISVPPALSKDWPNNLHFHFSSPIFQPGDEVLTQKG